MKFKNVSIKLLIILLAFNACVSEPEDELLPSGLLSNESAIKDPRFSDSWGYLCAQTMTTISNVNNPSDTIKYSNIGMFSYAYFLPTMNSDHFMPEGAGVVKLNNNPLDLGIISYWGTKDSLGVPFYVDFNGVANWSVSGNSNVEAFSTTNNYFPVIHSIYIPSWQSVDVTQPLTITIFGYFSEATNIVIELESESPVEKYVSKTITGASNSVTFSAEELKALKANYSLGVTLKINAQYAKATTSTSKKYYMGNDFYLTHAIYFN